ncbi:MAG: hypothetical protein MUF12_04955, partial [Sediminibacterium sp.]|nr:hypothetical protein [Sediminibacterium sp.]
MVELSLAGKLRKMRGIVSWIPLLLILSSCGKESCKTIQEAEQTPAPIRIERFDQLLAELKDTTSVVRFLENEPKFADKFLQIYGYPDKRMLYNQILALNEDVYMDSLAEQTYKAFPSTELLENELQKLFGYLRFFDSKIEIPQTVTVLTGFGTDLF